MQTSRVDPQAEGVLVTEESLFVVHRTRLTEFAARYKLPAVYPFLLAVTDAGADGLRCSRS
jgi:hypothetical protein